MDTTIRKCPQCKSTNVTVNSKAKFFRNSAICQAITLFFGFLFFELTKERDVDPVILLGFLFCFLGCATGAFLCLYYFIRALSTKVTTYKCRHCEKLSAERFDTEQSSVEMETLLKKLRKK